jgi:hypothetical protein
MNRKLLPSLMVALVTVIASCTSEPEPGPDPDIFLLRGEDLIQLTDDPGGDFDPTW